jgi:hypothetical protein
MTKTKEVYFRLEPKNSEFKVKNQEQKEISP